MLMVGWGQGPTSLLATKALHVTDLTALGHLDQYHYGGIQAGRDSL